MASNIISNLSDKVPAALGTKAAYGEQVDLDGTKLIPVAYSAFGFGGGEGTGAEEGVGGGGGGASIPIGAYISRGGDVRFEPNLIALLAVGIPFVCVAGRALARVIRALKR
ncbi:MAG: hypothetical protein ACOYBP_07795 [Microbacteriaceae bacterium]